MSGIQLSGLASGLDWQTLVDKLVAADSAPETKMKSDKSVNAQKLSAIDSVRTRLTDLQTSLSSLQSGTLFSARSATLGNASSGWSATASAGAANGQYAFNVTQLATSASRQGAASVSKGLSNTSDVSGLTLATLPTAKAITAGNFTVNGAQVSIAATDSLQDVFSKINTATNGAVTASYDPASDGIKLQSTSGPVALGAANDTSNFLSAAKLYNNGTSSVGSSGALGAVQINKPLASAGLKNAINADAGGAGAFSVNGVSISYNVNADSISSILKRVNDSGAGVTAAYDSAADRFTFTNKTTGDTTITATDVSGGLLSAMGLNAGSAASVAGKNAKFTVNGGAEMISQSNTLDADATGITGLSVTASNTGQQSVSVGSDGSSAKTAINDFISKFNSLQDYIADQTKITSANGKVTAATLAGNSDIVGIGRNLRQLVFGAVTGADSVSRRLQSMGIDFKSGTSDLTVVNSAKLDKALSSDSDGVTSLFQDKTSGLTAKLGTYLTQITGDAGTLTTQTTTINKRQTSLDKQIADFERRMTAERNRLTLAFTAMETAQSQLQNQSTILTNAFSSRNSNN